jgi:methanogenic corrinoid protein MtbC1
VNPPNTFAANLLRSSVRAYAAAAVERMHEVDPKLLERGLPPTFARPVDDTEVRLLHLAEAVAFDRHELLVRAVEWYKVAFAHRNVPAEYLDANLAAIETVLQRELPPASAAVALRHLAAARRALPNAPVELPSFLSLQAPHGELSARFLLAVLEGRGDDAVYMIRNAAADGLSVAEIHDDVLTVVQRELGRMWLMAEVPIADEHFGSTLVDRVLWSLHDHLPRPADDAPVVLTMGVGGNLHDFGLRMVAQRLQMAGYRVHHLGGNMPAGDLEWALQDRKVDCIAIAATMILHLSTLAATVGDIRRIERLRERGRGSPILVGGEIFGRVAGLEVAVGADAGADSAATAVAAVQRLLGR